MEGDRASTKPVHHPALRRGAEAVGGSRRKIYVTVFRSDARKDRVVRRRGIGEPADCRATGYATADREQVAKAVLQETPARSRRRATIRAAARFFPLASSSRSRRSRVSCPSNGVCLSRAIARGISRASSSTKAWQHRSVAPRSGVGWRAMPFARGTSAVGSSRAILTLRRRRVASLICIDRTWEGRPLRDDDYVLCADGKPVFRPAPGSTRAVRQGLTARCVSSTSTSALARWSTWPPGTCIAPRLIGRCEPASGIVRSMRLVGSGDDAGTVCLRSPRVLGRGQWVLAPRRACRETARQAMAKSGPRSFAYSRQLAEPD